ncbi:GNAT family N-acetyltransferase [Nocardioides caldifontis]|uniref:GNAT family N-acetyltransferase n=1 Tax=Nocardioides caldifontis TaxID=2588938 RepID=UPI0011E056D6|nr:GNAT family N-acetyltransferase [Nocardioides caldifontis]
MTDVAQLTVPLQRWIARQRHRGDAPPATQVSAAPEVMLPAGVRVRRRRDHEVAACARLLGLVQAEGGYPLPRPESLRGWLTDAGLEGAWIAERQGEVLGHVAVGRVGHDAVSRMRWREAGRPVEQLMGVSRLFVRPRAREQGIGAALLTTAVADVRARGLTPVAELVSPGREGVRLYEKHGWRLVARHACGGRDAGLTSYMYLLPPQVPTPR